jgi:hypothetical protein
MILMACGRAGIDHRPPWLTAAAARRLRDPPSAAEMAA